MSTFQTSVLNFLSKYDHWEVTNSLPFESPFTIFYSERYNVYIHLVTIAKLHQLKDVNFFQNMSSYCYTHRIKFIHLREEIWMHKKDFVKSRLNSIFNSNTKIHARQCVVKRIHKAEYDLFLGQTHLLNTAKSKFKYGLYKKEQLLAVMGVSGGRWMTKDEDRRRSFEIIRFATSNNTTVVGGFSKLLKHAELELGVQEWMSYFDLDWVLSNVYQRMGFVFKEWMPAKEFELPESKEKSFTSGSLKLIKRIDGK